jgi:hypothetical protein
VNDEWFMGVVSWGQEHCTLHLHVRCFDISHIYSSCFPLFHSPPCPFSAYFLTPPHLQFIPNPILTLTQIRHSHYLNHQASPAGEMLRPLPLTRLGVVLLPSKAGLLPTVIYSVDKILAEFGVNFSCARLVGTRLLGNVLRTMLALCLK